MLIERLRELMPIVSVRKLCTLREHQPGNGMTSIVVALRGWTAIKLLLWPYKNSVKTLTAMAIVA